MCFPGFESFMSTPPTSSEVLAEEMEALYREPCIEAFGPGRCMFESNFPVDIGSCTYATLWNALETHRRKLFRFSTKKAALFSGTARRVYRLQIPLDG